MTQDHLTPDSTPPQPLEEDQPSRLTDPRPEVQKFTPDVLHTEDAGGSVSLPVSPMDQLGAVEGDAPGDPTNVNQERMGVASTLDETGGSPKEEIPGG
ncbi:MAG: hypothetical protein KIT87_09235 [Anaerolineae bacterium]|nr:hypothetical protein [Anaerolineae bacterium]